MNAKDDIAYEAVNCIMCAGQDFEDEAAGCDYIYECSKDIFHIVKCLNCGHLFLNPRPRSSSSELIYPKNYATLVRHHARAGMGISSLRSWIILRRLRKLRNVFRSGASVLDVGCGDGQLLLDLRERYPEVGFDGLDINFSEIVENLLAGKNINIIKGRLEDVNLKNNNYDAIIMNQLIEHLWEPEKALKKAFEALKPGGFLSVETINIDGYDRSLFKGGLWGGYYMPRHLNLFNNKSLRKLLEMSGFVVEEEYDLLAPIVWTYSLRAWIVERFGKRPLVMKMLSDVNPFALALFAMIDCVTRCMRLKTSNQKMIARKIPAQ